MPFSRRVMLKPSDYVQTVTTRYLQALLPNWPQTRSCVPANLPCLELPVTLSPAASLAVRYSLLFDLGKIRFNVFATRQCPLQWHIQFNYLTQESQTA